MSEIEPTKSLTKQEDFFVFEYMKDFNSVRACMVAGFEGDTAGDHTARAYWLLQQPHISRRISIEVDTRNNMVAADKRYVINKLVSVVEADIAQYVIEGKDGITEKKYTEMPPEIRRMIEQAERTEKVDKMSGETTVSYKFKLMSKTKCLDMLAKHLGIFQEVAPINIQINTFSDWAKKMNAELEAEKKDD